MESLTYFTTEQAYQNYKDQGLNVYPQVAYVEDNEANQNHPDYPKVYLDEKPYAYSIHATFNIESAGSFRIMGKATKIINFAKIRITDPDDEVIITNPIKFFNFTKVGTYTVEYAIYDFVTTLPANTFYDVSRVTYVQVDTLNAGERVINKIGGGFIANCSSLTGALFGDAYPETRVFTDDSDNLIDYTTDDVIIGDHITSCGALLNQCTKVKNVYIGNSCTTTGNLFRGASSDIKTVVYFGKKLYYSSRPGNVFSYSNKVLKCIIHPENEHYLWDDTVNCVILKTDQPTKRIVIGGNGDEYGYMKIPSGYVIDTYETFRGRWGLKMVDLKEYDSNSFTGFIDCQNIITLVLGPNVERVEKFEGGKSNLTNFIIYAPMAPFCVWGGDWVPEWGNTTSVYSSSLFSAADWSNTTGYRNGQQGGQLYVLAGTEAEQNSWTGDYDMNTSKCSNPSGCQNTWGNKRPNIWKVACMRYDSPYVQSLSQSVRRSKTNTNYCGFDLTFKTEQELDTLVQTLKNELINPVTE